MKQYAPRFVTNTFDPPLPIPPHFTIKHAFKSTLTGKLVAAVFESKSACLMFHAPQMLDFLMEFLDNVIIPTNEVDTPENRQIRIDRLIALRKEVLEFVDALADEITQNCQCASCRAAKEIADKERAEKE